MHRIAPFAPLLVVSLLSLPAGAAEPNTPPRFTNEYPETRRTKGGELETIRLDAEDPDKDPLRFSCRNLPPHALLRADKDSVTILWRPRKDDHGSWEVECEVSDGHETATRIVRLQIDDEWQSYFMPGLSYSVFSPVSRGAWGTFHGVSAEILFASWIRRNENRGPSHGRVYLDMDILRSTRADTGAAFDLALGFDLSLERNPTRRWLLPYFGMRSGAFMQKDLTERGSTVWHLTPQAGAYLWADKNLFVTASAGYMLPISAARFEELRGLRANLGLNFSLW